MKVVRLQIDQQMARIGAESQRASLSIESEQREMNVKRQNAKMSVDRSSPQLELDIRDYFDHAGLCSVRAFSENTAAQAYAQASSGVSETVADGNYIGTLASSGNRIGQLAMSKVIESDAPEMCSGEVPYGTIPMNCLPGKTDIQWSKSNIEIAWDGYQPPKIEVKPEASVKIRLAQEPRLDVKTIEEEIPSEMYINEA